MFNKQFKRIVGLMLAMILALSVLPAETASAITSGDAVNTAQSVIASLTEEQLESYQVLNLNNRQSGLVGFEDEYTLEGSGLVNIIVEFVHQPPVVAQIEAAVTYNYFMSVDEAAILAEKDHADFRISLANLFGMARGASPYSITAEYKVAMNGVAMKLPADKVADIAAFDSVFAVYPDELVTLDPIETQITMNPYANAGADNVIIGMNTERNYMGIDKFHEQGITGQGITVCIIDTGIDYYHPDFAGAFARVSPTNDPADLHQDGYFYGRNFVNYDESPFTSKLNLDNRALNDPMEITYRDYLTAASNGLVLAEDETYMDFISFHGTHVAGTVAARGTNSPSAAKGIAPGATIYSYRVLSYGGGLNSWIISAIEMTDTDQPDVVNMSLGMNSGNAYSLTSQAVSRIMLDNPNMVFAIAAGNNGLSGSFTAGAPGAASLPITVGNGYLELKNTSMTAKVDEYSWYTYDMNLFYGSLNSSFTANTNGTYTSNYVDLVGQDDNGYYKLVVMSQDGNPINDYAGDWNIGTGTAEEFAAYADKNGADSLAGKIVAVYRGADFLKTWALAEQYHVGALILIDNDSSVYESRFVYRGSVKDRPPFFTMINYYGFAFVNEALSIGGKFAFIGSTDRDTGLHSTSSRGPAGISYDITPDIVGPGTDVNSTVPYFFTVAYREEAPAFEPTDGRYGGAYAISSGTSMACPHIAGIAALMKQYSGKQWDAEEIKIRMMNTADPMNGYSVHDVGAGFVNPPKAIGTNVTVAAHNRGYAYTKNETDEYSNYDSGSFSFGVYRMYENAGDFSKTIMATINNDSGSPKTFSVDYAFNSEGALVGNAAVNGVTLRIDAEAEDIGPGGSTSPVEITVNNKESADFYATIAIPKTAGNGSYQGYVTLTNMDGNGEIYRMPFAVHAKVSQSAFARRILNQPVISTSDDSIHVVDISNTADLLIEFTIPKNLYFGVIKGDATEDKWTDQREWLGEFGSRYLEGYEVPDALYLFDNVVWGGYHKYLVKDGVISNDPNEPIAVLDEGHYKLVIVAFDNEDEEYVAIDFYVDNTPAELSISNTNFVPGTDGDADTIYYAPGTTEIVITGTVDNTNLGDIVAAGVSYDVWDEEDDMPRTPDQTYNVLMAKVDGKYYRAEITNKDTGAFTLTIPVTESTIPAPVKLYILDSFSIRPFPEFTTYGTRVVMGAFDPDSPSYGFELNGERWAWYGANMITKDIELCLGGVRIVFNDSVKLAVGAERQIKAKLTQEAITEDYEIIGYTSSDSNIVSVDNGFITAKSEGMATITVRAQSPGKDDLTAVCTVTVVTNSSAGVKIEKGSYIYYGSYRHVLEAEMKTKLYIYSSGGYYDIPGNRVNNAHFAATKREETPTPVLWEVMGEEKIADDGRTDGYLTLMSHYVLDVADLMPMANYYFNSGNASMQASDLQRYLNGYDPTVWDYNAATGNYNMSELFFRNYYEDLKEWEAKNWNFLNNFNTAENNAIPYFDVWAGVYDADGVQNTGYVGGAIPNQKVYIPGSGFTAGRNMPFRTPSSFSMYWGAGSGEQLYDETAIVKKASVSSSGNLDGEYANSLRATLKSGQPITWRDRAGTANLVPMWCTTISPSGGLMGYTSNMLGTEYNGVYLADSKVGVRPATKIIPESIVYAYEITSGGENGAIKADSNYQLPAGLSGKVYKLTVIGENDGLSVGRLYNVPASYVGQDAIDGSYLTLANVSSDKNGLNYVIAYKIVDSSDNIVRYGEFPTSAEAQNLKLNIDGLNGDYKVYIWLQQNNEVSSNAAGVVNVFDLAVEESDDEVFYSIVTPDAVKNVPYGTAKTAEALGLPDTVKMITNKGYVDAAVTWKVSECGYDTDSIAAQEFAVTGEVALPTGIKNNKFIELVVYIGVSVKAKFFAVESITNVPETAVAGLDLVLGGTVTPANATNQTITWSVADAGTTGAVIKGNVLSTTGKGTVTVRATIENGLTETADYSALYEIAVRETPGKVLTGIVSPSPITGLVNGTSKTTDALCLPATVTLTTNGGNVSALVTWDATGSAYNPAWEDEQTFTVQGTVTLPQDVANSNNIPLVVSISVTVNAGVAVKKVLQSTSVRPDQILGVINGAPKTAEGLCLPATVTLNTDAGSVQANVIWNVDGCTYNESNTDQQEFYVSGTVILPQDVSNPNNVSSTVRVFVRVSGRITTEEDLQTITNPDPISGIANGAAKTADALGLPSTVTIWTANWYMLRAQVVWRLDECDYNQWLPTEQTFTVYGTVILPEGVANTYGYSIDTWVRVTVNAAIPKALVLQNIIQPDDIVGITNGVPKTPSTLGLPASVMIVTDGGNMSAEVVWNINAANYEPGLLTEQTFTVYGNLTLPAGVVNTNSINLSVSVNVTVNGASELTKVLLNIISPNPVTNIPNGAQKTAAALNLPLTAALNTSDGVIWTVVTWDVAGTNYDPGLLTQQTFTVIGTADLPSNVENSFGVPLDVTVSVTVNAVAKYLIMFETNGGNQITPQTVNAGGLVTVPPTPVREGYTFTGWYTTSGLSVLYDFNQQVTGSLTLYAGWIPVSVNTYLVTFEANGGNQVAPHTVNAGGLVTVPPTPVREGYTFTGWYTAAGLSVLYDFNQPVIGNLTLHAGWIPNSVTAYTVTFDSNGGNQVVSQTVNAGGVVIIPATPVRAGYTFDGWYADQALTVAYNFGWPVTASFTLYAKWSQVITAKDHTVTFVSNGGSYVASQKIAHGGVITGVDTIRNGYNFDGWYVDQALTILYYYNAPVAADIVLYAGWIRINEGGAGGLDESDPAPAKTPTPAQPPSTSNTQTPTSPPAPTPTPTPAPTPTPVASSSTTPAPTVTTGTQMSDSLGEIVNIPVISGNNLEGFIAKDEGDWLLGLSIWGQEQSGADSDEININIGSNKSIEISGTAAESVVEAGRSLSITNDALTVVIPPETLTQLVSGNAENGESAGDKTVEIRIASSLQVSIPEGLLTENPINADLLMLAIDVTILVDGQEITEFIMPLKLVFDLSGMNLTEEQISKLTVVRLHPDGTYEQIGGEWEDGFFVAYSSKLSQYTVIVSETLVKVVTTVDNNIYTVNGIACVADVEPFISEGRVMVPVKFIAEAFGAEVTWNEWSRTVAIMLDSKIIALTIDQLDAGMDVAPFIYEGRTMVPLRFISEKLGANVIWNPETRTVTIYR